MRYRDGELVCLGDLLEISIPDGSARARVVMLGDTREHLDIDRDFVDWVTRDNVLRPSDVVVEWIDANPFEHNDPRYAPVGNYMFTSLGSGITRIRG